MSTITPRNQHLRDQALAALSAIEVMSTGEVADAIGEPRHRQDTWRALDALAHAGIIERLSPRGTEQVWRRRWRAGEWPAPQDLTDLESLYVQPAAVRS